MAINKNIETKKIHTKSDRISSYVTKVAGSMPFLVINVLFFAFWILLNTGVFGHNLIVDTYPFSFLTTTVSIEAILLSTFVIMSQRREAKLSEARTELDYHSDLKAEVDINTIVNILERLAEKQNIDVSDLLSAMKKTETKTLDEAIKDENLNE
ncbi:MAG: hypothetical protein JWO54_946 [Candidatus Saccharibacteria bacterium]|nr:hypothetical protein [Candidatus Saccharibacteria bacterium]MDB5181183.1 hypothetical protein [Candidatus Saccharibacteria bacterium]